MPIWTVRPLREAFDDYASIAGESLQLYDRDIWNTYIRRVGSENLRGVWDGDRLAGGVAFYQMGQWYGGQCIPSAGVSGVAIDPADRGSGACKEMLQALLRELYAEKTPLASLYASTEYLYRSVGFEHSGIRTVYSLPMSSLRADSASRSVPVHRYVNPKFDTLAEIDAARGRRNNGLIKRTPGLWERIIEPHGATTSTYVIGEEPSPTGYLTLQHGTRAAGYPQTLVASDWAANTPEALQRLIALVRDHRSMCDRFQWNGGPQDPLLFAATEEKLEVVAQIRTLNRIIRFKEAVEQRGYPNSLDAELHFEIRDSILPDNAGAWTLKITGGSGSVSQGGDGAIKLDIATAVPMFCSLMSCSQLAALGRIACADQGQIELADAAFAGPLPWTAETF